MPEAAYLLIVHGSHHPSYQAAVKQLTMLLHEQLLPEQILSKSQSDNCLPNYPNFAARTGKNIELVDVAFLEAHPLPLHEQIVAFAARSVQQGMRRIQLLPLFLLPGVHVREDIPAAVAAARNMIDPEISLELLPYLGTHQKALCGLLLSLMATVSDSVAATLWILFSHGSRRPGGNQPVEAIAQQLTELSGMQVVTAYASVPPFLADRVVALNPRGTGKMGDRQMAILPYVLFPGELTEGIADFVTQLGETFEDIPAITQPIAVAADFAALILSLLGKYQGMLGI